MWVPTNNIHHTIWLYHWLRSAAGIFNDLDSVRIQPLLMKYPERRQAKNVLARASTSLSGPAAVPSLLLHPPHFANNDNSVNLVRFHLPSHRTHIPKYDIPFESMVWTVVSLIFTNNLPPQMRSKNILRVDITLRSIGVIVSHYIERTSILNPYCTPYCTQMA